MPNLRQSYQAKRYDALAGRKKPRMTTTIVKSSYPGVMRGPALPPGWSKTAMGSRGPSRARPEELKYLDIGSATYKFENDATRAVLINGVATGSTSITREGNQCYWKTIQIRGSIKPTTPTAANTAQRCDLYVVYDDQPGAAVPTNAEILTSSESMSFMNLDYRERFRVLHHSSYCFGPGDITATQAYVVSPQISNVDLYIRCNVRTSFKGVGNAIGDISKGAIYIFTIGDSADATNTYPVLSAAIRLRFSER
nr:MAG: putative capsid protein [Arizlama virus]